MSDSRRKNVNWNVANKDGEVTVWEQVHTAILMDIRDELQSLNRLLNCHNFLEIPHTLKSIRKNTTKPKGKK